MPVSPCCPDRQPMTIHPGPGISALFLPAPRPQRFLNRRVYVEPCRPRWSDAANVPRPHRHAEAAPRNGWQIPDIRDLQKDYQEAGLSDTTKVKIIYFCNPQGGYDILKDDSNKSMSVMMPMGVSIYETSDGRVEIAAMNLGMMSGMFSGVSYSEAG